MRASADLALLVLGVAISGCAEDRYRPPTVWNGENLQFGTDEDLGSICGGTLDYSDRAIGYLAEVFDVQNPQINFFWTPEETGCAADDAIGCANGSEIWSKEPFHQHELVHAVRDGDVAYPPLEEGLAELYGDAWDPLLPLAGDAVVLWESHDEGAPLEGEWYPVAGHYVSFLRDAYGTEDLLDFVNISDHYDTWERTEALFEEVYLRTFDQAIEEYREYPACNQTLYRDNGFDCGSEPVRVADVGEPDQELRVSLDCEESTVVGPIRGERWTILTLEVPSSRLYEFGAAKLGGSSAGRIRVRECGQSCFDEGTPRFAFDLDLDPVLEDPGGWVSTCIDAGRYTMRLAVDEDDGGEFVIRFAPRNDAPGGSCD